MYLEQLKYYKVSFYKLMEDRLVIISSFGFFSEVKFHCTDIIFNVFFFLFKTLFKFVDCYWNG